MRTGTCTFQIQQHWNNQNRVAKIASLTRTHARVLTSSTRTAFISYYFYQMHDHVVL